MPPSLDDLLSPVAQSSTTSSKQTINNDRSAFLENKILDTSPLKGCLLVPTSTWFAPAYIKICGKSPIAIATDVYNELDRSHPKLYTAVQLENMIFRIRDRADFVNDTKDEVFFDWSGSDAKVTKTDGGEELLLTALQNAFRNNPTVSADTLRYLNHAGTKMGEFVWKQKLPLTLAFIVISLLAFLLLADDPRSLLPKDVYKWFATTSPLKKVVDAGQHWDANYGSRRPSLQPQNQFAQRPFVPPQDLLGQRPAQDPFSYRPSFPAQDRVPQAFQAHPQPPPTYDRDAYFSKAVQPVKTAQSLFDIANA